MDTPGALVATSEVTMRVVVRSVCGILLVAPTPVGQVVSGSVLLMGQLCEYVRGKITGSELWKRIVRVSTGCAAKYFVASAAFVVGTCLGGPWLGVFFGFVAGSIASYVGNQSAKSMLNLFSGVTDSEKMKEELDEDKLEKEAAEFLQVDLKVHSRDIAHLYFRTRLLQVHPDKCRNAPQHIQERNAVETIALTSAWQVVNNHYNNNKRKDH